VTFFERPPLTPLLRKLESVVRIDEDERRAVLGLAHTVRHVGAREDIATVGQRPAHCCLVLEGWAHRYAHTYQGDRQILSFYVAGDIPDLQHLYLPVMDHSLATLTSCTLAFISHKAMRELVERRPGVMAALWRDTLVDASVYRERIKTLGRRHALARVAHLLCEMYLRQRAVGLTDGPHCPMPATQFELADAVGMTHVHFNRSLRNLRARRWITLRGGILTVDDWQGLAAAAEFDPIYLHLNEPPGPNDGAIPV
jgi:CRP-like cAMP-binding protein